MPAKSWIEVPIDQEVWSVPESGYAPFFFPPEGDALLFFFTEESFLRVLSALINGAALTYPDTWIQVVWDFLQNVEYPVSLCDAIATAILECEDVQNALATVIEADGVVRDSIVSLVTSDPAINTYITNVFSRLTPETIAGQLAGGDCDPSVVAGRAIALVERLDTNNIDALEILEVGTNDEERLSQILSAFPGFGLLPLDELLDFAQDVLEDFAENYAAISTIERRDVFAEKVYCKMLEAVDCSITWQQMFDLVLEQVPSAPFDILVTIGDIIQFVGDGDFGNDDLLFYGMMLLQLSTITASSSFNGLTAPLMSAIMRDALPSSAWEEWDACPAPDEWIDNNFSGGNQYSWEDQNPGVGFAQWNGTGFERLNDATQIAIKKTISSEITDIEVYFNAPLSGSGGVMYAGATGLTGLQIGSTTDDQIWSWTGVAISGGLGLDLYRPGGFASNQYVTRVRYKIAP
jgi:hypothetical protein